MTLTDLAVQLVLAQQTHSICQCCQVAILTTWPDWLRKALAQDKPANNTMQVSQNDGRNQPCRLSNIFLPKGLAIW